MGLQDTQLTLHDPSRPCPATNSSWFSSFNVSTTSITSLLAAYEEQALQLVLGSLRNLTFNLPIIRDVNYLVCGARDLFAVNGTLVNLTDADRQSAVELLVNQTNLTDLRSALAGGEAALSGFAGFQQQWCC